MVFATAGAALLAVLWCRHGEPPAAPPPGAAAADRPLAAEDPRVAAVGPAVVDRPGVAPALRRPTTPVDAATDPAWHTLPRVTKDLVRRLLLTQQCDPSQLYRSASFNPRDLWLAPPVRREIAHIAEASGSRLQALRAELLAAKEREFAALHAAGQTFAVDLSTLAGQTRLQRAGADPVFAEVDGRTLVAARAAMPDTAAAATAVDRATAELCAELAHAFAAHGALQPAELAALLAAAGPPAPAAR